MCQFRNLSMVYNLHLGGWFAIICFSRGSYVLSIIFVFVLFVHMRCLWLFMSGLTVCGEFGH